MTLCASDSPPPCSNYPHLTKPVAPGQLRIAPHTDYGTVTLLRADNSPGGSLQVQMRDGAWRDVVFTDDCYVVNLGDLMQRWTNDLYKSTLHRVIPPALPPGSEGVDTRRISVAFFHNLDRDAVCETIGARWWAPGRHAAVRSDCLPCAPPCAQARAWTPSTPPATRPSTRGTTSCSATRARWATSRWLPSVRGSAAARVAAGSSPRPSQRSSSVQVQGLHLSHLFSPI